MGKALAMISVEEGVKSKQKMFNIKRYSTLGYQSMTNSSTASPIHTTPLQRIKISLERSIRLHGSDNLSSRMLQAEITRYERALQEKPQTMAQQFKDRPIL